MPKGIMVVQSNPIDPDREDDFNDWYDNTHLPEVRAIPGFVEARRFKVHAGASATYTYVAIYELEADDLTAPMTELRARSKAGRMTHRDVVGLDPPPLVTLYDLVE